MSGMAWGAPTAVQFDRHAGTIWDHEYASLPDVMDFIQNVNRAMDKSVPLEDRAEALTSVFGRLLPLLGEKYGKPLMDSCVPLVLRAAAFLLLDGMVNTHSDESGGYLREVAEKADQLHREHLPHDCAVLEDEAYAKLREAGGMALLEKLLGEKENLELRSVIQVLEDHWPLLDLRLEYFVRGDAYSNEQLIILVEALLYAIRWLRIWRISVLAVFRHELKRLEAKLIQWKLVLAGIAGKDVKLANFQELTDHATPTVVVAIETLLLLMRRVTSCSAQKIEPTLKTKAKLLDSLFLPQVVAMVLRDVMMHEASAEGFLKVLALALLDPWLDGRRQIEPIAYDVVILMSGSSFLVPLAREIVCQMQKAAPYTHGDHVPFLVELIWRVLLEAGRCENPSERLLATTETVSGLMQVLLDGGIFKKYRKGVILAAFSASMSVMKRNIFTRSLMDDAEESTNSSSVEVPDLSAQTAKKLKMLLEHTIHPSLVGLIHGQKMDEALDKIVETGESTLNLAELSLVGDGIVSQPDSFSAPLVKKMNSAPENDEEVDLTDEGDSSDGELTYSQMVASSATEG